MNHIPRVPIELSIGGVYIAPMFFGIILGVLITWGFTRLLNKWNLSRFFWNPPLAFLAFSVIFSGLVGRWIILF